MRVFPLRLFPGAGRRLGFCAGLAVLAGAALTGGALRGDAALVEQVIAFDGVAVEGPEGASDTPEVAHRDRPDETEAATPGAEVVYRRSDGRDTREISREERILDVALELRMIGRSEPYDRYLYQARDGHYQHIGYGRDDALRALRERPGLVEEFEEQASRIRPDWAKAFEPIKKGAAPVPMFPLALAPGQAVPANPSFVEEGFRVEAFWAVRTGTPGGFFMRAHFHPPDLSTGFEAQHLGNRWELHGVHIRSVDGRPFALRRLRCRATLNRQLPHKAFSVDGYSNFSPQVLVARSFDPRRPVRAQFTGFPVGPSLGNDTGLPWQTVSVFGFEYVRQVYIASSASVDLDDIVVVRLESAD